MLTSLPVRPRRHLGFTLVELMVVIALIAILLRLAIPGFTTMLRNAQARTAADSLQNGLRTAQSLAIRENRVTMLSFTNAVPSISSAAVANGVNWAIHTVARTDGDPLAFAEGSPVAEGSSATVNTNGRTAVCFSSSGRLVARTEDTLGVTNAVCTLPTTGNIQSFDIDVTGGDRPLRVELNTSGRVRLCDPKRTLAADTPDGCTPSTP